MMKLKMSINYSISTKSDNFNNRTPETMSSNDFKSITPNIKSSDDNKRNLVRFLQSIAICIIVLIVSFHWGVGGWAGELVVGFFCYVFLYFIAERFGIDMSSITKNAIEIIDRAAPPNY